MVIYLSSSVRRDHRGPKPLIHSRTRGRLKPSLVAQLHLFKITRGFQGLGLVYQPLVEVSHV